MIATLRTLERRLVHERAQITVTQVVDRFLHDWDHALSEDIAPPDSLGFFKALTDAGFYLPTSPGAQGYLDRCRSEATLPDRAHLLRMLLPPNISRPDYPYMGRL